MKQAGSGDNSTSSASPTKLVGWVNESEGRGSLNLIVSCTFTIFLCTWAVIHPRVHRRKLLGFLYKITLFLKAIVAPELIVVEGLQEWNQARKMVSNCSKLTKGQLKLVHAFYIGMLALKYRKSQGGESVIWPNQYTWLLQEGLIDWSDHARWALSEEVIRDKSNADGTVKLAALFQVTWFVAQSIMRTAHGLPLAPLESMALSYIPLFAVTYFFWWLKPKDISTPSLVDLPNMSEDQKSEFEAMAVSTTFDCDDIGQQDSLWIIWQLTPRVFEKEARDKAFLEAETRALEKRALKRANNLKDMPSRSDINEDMRKEYNPNEIVLGIWDPELHGYRSKIWPAICLFGLSFPALHLISWYTLFPTVVEQWLWRGAALVSIFSMLVFMQFEKVTFHLGGGLAVISLLSPLLYLLSRIVLIAGVIAAFRASDPKIYDTYVVSNYWIHVL